VITWKRCKKCNKQLIGVADTLKQDTYCGDLMIGSCRKSLKAGGEFLKGFFGL
jgi:hypothetical protein